MTDSNNQDSNDCILKSKTSKKMKWTKNEEKMYLTTNNNILD